MARLAWFGLSTFLVGTGMLVVLNAVAPLPNRADTLVLPTLVGLVLFVSGQVALACCGIVLMVRGLRDGD